MIEEGSITSASASQTVQDAGRRSTPTGEGAFAFLPNEIVRNSSLSPEALVVLAFRMTIADAQSDYGLNAKFLRKQVPLSLNKANDAISELVAAGYLERDPRRRKNAMGQYIANPKDRLTLKATQHQTEQNHCRHFKRAWLGHVRFEELAVWLYIRAGRPDRKVRYERDIRQRFGWGVEKTTNVVRSLVSKGLVRRKRSRGAGGRYTSVRLELTGLTPDQIHRTGSSTHGFPGHGSGPHLRTVSSHASLGESNNTDYSPHAPRERSLRKNIDWSALRAALEDAYENDRLLGWIGNDPISDAIEYGIAPSKEAFRAVIKAMPEEGVRDFVLAATETRVHPDIISLPGIAALRFIAADLVDRSDGHWSGNEALGFVLSAIENRFKGSDDALNSLKLIGIRICVEHQHGSLEKELFRPRNAVSTWEEDDQSDES